MRDNVIWGVDFKRRREEEFSAAEKAVISALSKIVDDVLIVTDDTAPSEYCAPEYDLA